MIISKIAINELREVDSINITIKDNWRDNYEESANNSKFR